MNRRSILQTFLTGFLSASITSYAAGKDLKSLIVFYSRSGHTETLANTLAKLTGAETIRIESTSPYPTDYDATIERFKAERAANTLPAIYPIEKDLNSYDVIYIGSPTWGGHLCYPIQRFLQDTKLRGNTLMLFTSHGGSGEASTLDDLQRLAPGNQYRNIAFYGSGFGASKQFKHWLSI